MSPKRSLVPSSRARHSGTRISFASVVRFIEDNWLHGQRLGGGSFDATAGSINGLFDFSGSGKTAALYLDPSNGTPLKAPPPSGDAH